MNNEEDTPCPIFALFLCAAFYIVVLVFCCAIIYNVFHNSVINSDGRNIGYSEHNYTKYIEYKNYTENVDSNKYILDYEPDYYSFAEGYCYGYNKWIAETETQPMIDEMESRNVWSVMSDGDD